jgi:hypothetical protein
MIIHPSSLEIRAKQTRGTIAAHTGVLSMLSSVRTRKGVHASDVVLILAAASFLVVGLSVMLLAA